MATKRWGDFSSSQKTGIIVIGILQVGLLLAALWDLAHRSADEVRGDRRMWAGLVFINWVGPLAYFTLGRRSGAGRPHYTVLKTGAEASSEEEDVSPGGDPTGADEPQYG